MKKFVIFTVGLILLVLAACGNSGEEDKADSDKKDDDSTADERSVTIEDAYGEQKIDGTPEKIVVLEWSYAENLLAMGVQPAGVADIDGFNKWLNIDKEFDESVKDVGTRQEPNLEAISRLDPDLIIGVKFRHDQFKDKLKDIAPVVMFEPYGEAGVKDQYGNMINEFKKMAKITDTQDEAEQAIAELDSFVEKQKERVADAGLEGSSYLVTQAFTAQNTPTMRLFTDNSMIGKLMGKFGFENAYQSEEPEVYGYSEVTVEALQNFQDEDDLQFLYIVQEDDNIFDNQLKGNPVWEELSFVKNGNTHKLPGDTWTFGGVLSNKVLAKQLVDAMVKE